MLKTASKMCCHNYGTPCRADVVIKHEAPQKKNLHFSATLLVPRNNFYSTCGKLE